MSIRHTTLYLNLSMTTWMVTHPSKMFIKQCFRMFHSWNILTGTTSLTCRYLYPQLYPHPHTYIQWHLADLQLVGSYFIIRQVPPLSLALEEPGTATNVRHRLLPVDGSPLATMKVNIIPTTISRNKHLIGWDKSNNYQRYIYTHHIYAVSLYRDLPRILWRHRDGCDFGRS